MSKTKKILISGSTGFVGSHLLRACRDLGHTPIRLVRTTRTTSDTSFFWDPSRQEIDPEALQGVDTVIHLAGENVADGYWSRKKKDRILQSRIHSTKFLVNEILKQKKKPKTLICASAVGWYGNRGSDVLDEAQPAGRGFLADVAKVWEKEANLAAEGGVRVAHLRLGLILSGDGGAMEKILPPFQMGLGGPLGDGSQFVSWITIEDVIRSIFFIMDHKKISGPVNITAPEPVTNAQFGKILAEVLNRPFLIPTPAFALKLGLGDMAKELLLSSIRAIPKKLQDHGFIFENPDLKKVFKKMV